MRDRYGNTVKFVRTSKDGRGAFGNITQITGPNGRFIQFTYNAQNRITAATDNIGRSVAYTYDTYGRLTTITKPGGGTTTYSWGACTGSEATCTHLITITDARGNARLTNTYSNGRVSQQQLADGGTYQFAYTLSGGVVTQTDITGPRGDVIRKLFNTAGYVTATTRALGQPEQSTTAITRAAGSNFVSSTTDQLGRVTTYGRDSLGNLTTITHLSGTADAITTTFTYSPTFSQVTSVIDPLGHTRTFTYDPHGNRVTASNALGATTTMTYAATGQIKSSVDPLGHTTTFAYEGGDLVSIIDALGRVWRRFVDAVGRTTSIISPAGAVHTYSYDASNRLKQSADANGAAWSFNYDNNGNVTASVDPRGGTITFAYDSLNRAVTRTDALGQSETFSYDLAGNLVRFTDRKGQVSGYSYDYLHRLTSVGFGATPSSPTAYTSTITYVLDAANRVVNLQDSASGAITRHYDGLDRLIAESTPFGTVTSSFDAAGRRISMSVPSQGTTTYSFDLANRVQSITRGTDTVSITRDAAGRRTSMSLPNMITATYAYDSVDRLVAISYSHGTTTIGDLTYSYDAANRRTAIGGSFARTVLPAAVASATYDAANRLQVWDGNSVSYDLNGNLANGFGRSLMWDARDQLASISGFSTATFAYDGDGRRTEKVIGSNSTRFVYDHIQPVQERSVAGAVSADLLTGGLDEIFSRRPAGGAAENFLTDALGSPLRLTDELRAKIVDYSYEPYGKPSADSMTSSNPFQFTGREHDGTGFQYNRARYLHPEAGRFISEDPAGIVYSFNPYSYADGNPVTWSDPDGFQPRTSLPSSREIRRSGGALPSEPPSMSTNNAWRDLFRDFGNFPTPVDTNLPGVFPGINYSPPINQPINLPPRTRNGCRVIRRPAPSNICPALPPAEVYCGPVMSAIR